MDKGSAIVVVEHRRGRKRAREKPVFLESVAEEIEQGGDDAFRDDDVDYPEIIGAFFVIVGVRGTDKTHGSDRYALLYPVYAMLGMSPVDEEYFIEIMTMANSELPFVADIGRIPPVRRVQERGGIELNRFQGMSSSEKYYSI
jgi:hypothetical protein